MSKKRERHTSFEAMVREQRRSLGDPRDGRSRDRVTDDGAWDADGRFWPRSEDVLSATEVEDALGSVDLVGIQGGYERPPRWYPGTSARAVWRDEVGEHFAPQGDLRAGGWPTEVAYVAELRRRPDGQTLLWFGGAC